MSGSEGVISGFSSQAQANSGSPERSPDANFSPSRNADINADVAVAVPIFNDVPEPDLHVAVLY